MNVQSATYQIWVDWDQAIVSFHPIPGYEMVHFESMENYRAKVHILVQSGFRFQ